MILSVHGDDDITFYQNLFTTADAKNDGDEQIDEDREYGRVMIFLCAHS